MNGIICAVRGGLESRAGITRAIGLAQALGLPLHFVYVVNQELVPDSGSELGVAATNQLQQMGESVLSVPSARDTIAGTLGNAREGQPCSSP
jgi:hypothetical protein